MVKIVSRAKNIFVFTSYFHLCQIQKIGKYISFHTDMLPSLISIRGIIILIHLN